MGVLELRYSLYISTGNSSLLLCHLLWVSKKAKGMSHLIKFPFLESSQLQVREKWSQKRRRPNFLQSFVQNPTRIVSQKLRSEKQANLFSNPMLSCPSRSLFGNVSKSKVEQSLFLSFEIL